VYQLFCWLSRAVVIAAVFLISFSGSVQAVPVPSPEVVRGTIWLQNQVQLTGALTNESMSIATTLQSRSETLLTLNLLSSIPSALADQLSADTEDNTEFIARRAVTLSVAGRDASALTTLLVSRQNLDGGFGGATGHESNALDTAWVLMALAQNSLSNQSAALNARAFLLAAIQSDGGIAANNDAVRVSVNALALLALQMSPSDLNTATALKKITAWLLLKQGLDGSWLGDSYLTALTLSSVSPLVSDPAISANTRVYLTGLQGVDGSWGGGDPFLTAIVLRALAYVPPVNSVLTSSIIGHVVDNNTATALSGATIILSGASSATTITAIDGGLSLPNLVAGSYSLQISKAGYNTYTNSYQLSAGQTLDTGAIVLNQVSSASIVRGQITEAATGKPLNGVTILLNAGVSTTVTDANGLYAFTSVKPGVVSVSTDLAGYTSASGTGSVLAGQTLIFSPALYATGVTAPTTGHFIGKVVAAGGSTPLAGVSILLNGTMAGVTVADGSFDLTLPLATYAVVFSSAGYDSASASFLLTAGAIVNAGTISLTKQVTSTTISGVIKDQVSGNPINGAQVQILNGVLVTTGIDGSYSLSGLSGTSFDLRVSATGYVTQSLQLQVSKPGNVVQDIAMLIQSGVGLSIDPLMVSPASAISRTDIIANAVINNAATGSAVSGTLTMQVINAQGIVVSKAVAYDKTGGNIVGVFALDPAQQLPVQFHWNTGQFKPGAYSLIARVIEAGSISTTTPLGRVLAESQGSLVITADQHFGGTISADPPVLQANTNTPVKLSAILVNDGNTDIPPQTYQLQIINAATGAVVATQQADGNIFAPNELQSLTFADWLPTTGGGNYRIELQVASNSTLGKVLGKVYVGDAATAAFTVNKLVVPEGTQLVKGNVHVVGQDVTQGTISDPLAPLIKAAIQKGVSYNDTTASSETLSTKCLRCHVQSQALVGGEKTRLLTTYNVAQRNIIFNSLSTNQLSNGSIDTSYACCYLRTETMLGMWALNAWHKTNEIVSTLVRGADYLLSTQSGNGSWYADHVSGWWASYVSNTSFNLKSLIDVHNTLTQQPAGSAVNYSTSPWASGNGIAGSNKNMLSDSVGNVYVSSYGSGTVSMVKPDGTVQPLISGLINPYAMALANDGSLYVTTYGSGLKRRAPDGTVTTVTTNRGTDIAFTPDGNLYMASYWDNAIYQITPQGSTSTYVSGGALSNPYGISVNAVGELLVANYSNQKILKYKADKSVEEVVAWTNGNPIRIQPDGTGWLVGTTTGLFRYNSEWQGERLMFDQTIWSITSTASGQLMVGDANSLYTVKKTPVDVAAKLTSLDSGITKATNWLLVDANTDSNSNLQLAHRLIGLGEANKYYVGTSMATTLQAKMSTVAATLKLRQYTDGGWGQSSNYASDAMVTAQVGFALDYMQPSPKDPVVQSAIKYLLNSQQADGSWYSQNGILATHLAATTWVEIWLPIALDRIGGIDTDLTVSMPANVSLANPNLVPTSSTANTAGGTDYVWKLQGVTSAGQDINFDLSLSNMILGENRPVAADAHLTFNNSFTQLPVQAPISVPRVTASAFLNLGVTTDKTSYAASTPVNISAAVNNSSVGLLSGSVKLEIYAADNVLTAVVGTQPFAGLAAGTQNTLSATWNSGTVAAGGYYVLATLFDAQNNFVGTAKSVFDVTVSGSGPGTSSVGAQVTLDKLIYQSFDLAKISGRVSNLTQNQTLDNLHAVLNVYMPNGSLMYTQSGLLAQLLAGSFIDLGYATQLSSAPAGTYHVVLLVNNASSVEVARSEAYFGVLSSTVTGSGLKGVILAQPKVVPQTDPVVLSSTLNNLGNAGYSALPVTISIVDPSQQLVLSQQSYTVALAQGQNYQLASSWDSSLGNVGSTYVAILTASVGGKVIVLSQDNFLVTEPPVKLDVKQSAVRENRVLVWLACGSEEEQQSVKEVKASGKDAHISGKSDDKDHPQPLPACVQARSAYLQGLLTSLKVAYLITANQNDFRNAFRSGSYNVYWLSGTIKSDEDFTQEIREAVNRGDGLIMDGMHDEHSAPLQEAAGIAYRGNLPLKSATITSDALLFRAGTLPTLGQAQKLLTTAGVIQAHFDTVLKTDDHSAEDHAKEAHSDDDHTGDDTHKATQQPAIVSNDYGRGHALAFAFDLVKTLQNNPTSTDWVGLLQLGFTDVMPQLPNTYSAGAYVALNTQIQNLAKAVDLAVATQLPTGATLLQTTPLAVRDTNGQPTWNFTLPLASTQTLQLSMRLPALSGTPMARTTVDSIRNGKNKRYGEYVFNWSVTASAELGSNLLNDLQALVLSKGEEREARDQAVNSLQNALASITQTQYDVALDALLDAVEKLRKITSVDIGSYRLSLDNLLQETGWNWLRSTAPATENDTKQ
jgi:hypothetical protein